jgi:hypothetical protein
MQPSRQDWRRKHTFFLLACKQQGEDKKICQVTNAAEFSGGGIFMQLINPAEVQERLDQLRGQDVYIHLEMTSGAYAAHRDSSKHPASTFITNALIRYAYGSIEGEGPYRVGLKMEKGWVYSEGLTHWDQTDSERLILAGHDAQGKLVVALQLSRNPF